MPRDQLLKRNNKHINIKIQLSAKTLPDKNITITKKKLKKLKRIFCGQKT